jgi:hypothetical protein
MKKVRENPDPYKLALCNAGGLVVVVPPVMDMPVGELFIAGFTQVDDGDIEVKFFSGQGVIGVQHDNIASDLDDGGEHHITVIIRDFQFHTDLHRDVVREFPPIYFQNRIWFDQAVTVFGGDDDFFVIANFHPFYLTLETGNDVGMALQVIQRAAFLRRIHDFSIYGEGIFNGYDEIISGLGGFVCLTHKYLRGISYQVQFADLLFAQPAEGL